MGWHKAAGIEGLLTSVGDFAKLISFFSAPFVFRGEEEAFESRLQPVAFRKDWNSGEELFRHEVDEIEIAQRKYFDGSIEDRFLNAFAPRMHLDDVNWVFLARHIGQSTRLLDVSLNPLVALYFACGGSADRNGMVYFFGRNGFRPVRSEYLDWLDAQDFPIIPISYSQLLRFEFDDMKPPVPYLVEPSFPNERLQAQSGMFMIWEDRDARIQDATQVFVCAVEGKQKSVIRQQLRSFGINDYSLFPNSPDHKSKSLAQLIS